MNKQQIIDQINKNEFSHADLMEIEKALADAKKLAFEKRKNTPCNNSFFCN